MGKDDLPKTKYGNGFPSAEKRKEMIKNFALCFGFVPIEKETTNSEKAETAAR